MKTRKRKEFHRKKERKSFLSRHCRYCSHSCSTRSLGGPVSAHEFLLPIFEHFAHQILKNNFDCFRRDLFLKRINVKKKKKLLKSVKVGKKSNYGESGKSLILLSDFLFRKTTRRIMDLFCPIIIINQDIGRGRRR